MSSLPIGDKWPSNRVLVLLCGCLTIVLVEPAPSPGEEWLCPRHGMQWITEVDVEYRVRCLDCSVSKPFSKALLQAQLFADQHSRRKPLHRIHVRKGSEVVEVRIPRVVMKTLPFDAPF